LRSWLNPDLLVRLFTKTGLVSGAAARKVCEALSDACCDRSDPPERKIKLRSGEDGEFSNN
jgi:hypothetical protein